MVGQDGLDIRLHRAPVHGRYLRHGNELRGNEDVVDAGNGEKAVGERIVLSLFLRRIGRHVVAEGAVVRRELEAVRVRGGLGLGRGHGQHSGLVVENEERLVFKNEARPREFALEREWDFIV